MNKLYLSWIIISLITGAASYYIAKKHGRNAAAWFAGGVAFNILALIALYLINHFKKGARYGFQKSH